MRSFIPLIGVIVLLCTQHAVSSDITPGCETVGRAQGICGFPAPEDIDQMPDGKHLLLSPFGGMSGEHPKSFYLFNIDTLAIQPARYDFSQANEAWGDASCSTAPAARMGGHGIHISQRRDGRWQLLAVNHSRESVEFFEITEREDAPLLVWRGCAIAPANSTLNDVTALPGGGFLVSHMFDRGSVELVAAMTSPEVRGHILRWRPNQGFDVLPGSQSRVPNGVAVSPDGESVWFSETAGQKISKIDYKTGKLLGQIPLGPSDNLSWHDGRLIATAITAPMPAECYSSDGPCLAPFKVVAIDTDTLQTHTLIEHSGPPMGASSVALVSQPYVYVGTFKGHQIMRITLPKKP